MSSRVVTLTNGGGWARVQPAEDDVALGKVFGHALFHFERGDMIGYCPCLLPSPRDSFLVRLARTAARSAQGVDGEVGMLGKQQDEALAHRA